MFTVTMENLSAESLTTLYVDGIEVMKVKEPWRNGLHGAGTPTGELAASYNNNLNLSFFHRSLFIEK